MRGDEGAFLPSDLLPGRCSKSFALLYQTSKHTKDVGAIQKGADFVKAYSLGFDVNVRCSALVHLFIDL